MTDPH